MVSYLTLMTPDKLKSSYDGLLFFSPSGIESYLQKNKPGTEVAFCIGGTTAGAARKAFQRVVEAKSPSVEAVLQSVNDHFETKQGS